MEGELAKILSTDDLTKLKGIGEKLRKLTGENLKPLQDTFAGEARRIISLHKRMEQAKVDIEKIVNELNSLIMVSK